MQIHAQVGAEIVDAVPFPFPVAPLIRSHHERWDGTGYPVGTARRRRFRSVRESSRSSTLRCGHLRAAVSASSVAGCRARDPEARPAGKAFDPAIVKHFTRLVPRLSPPTRRASRELGSRATGRADAAAAHEAGACDRMTADAFAEIALANRESYTLYEIAQAMGGSLSLSETMTLISSKAERPVPFSSCALFVREQNTLRCRFATGLDAHLMAMPESRKGIGPAAGSRGTGGRSSTASPSSSPRRGAGGRRDRAGVGAGLPAVRRRQVDRHYCGVSRRGRLLHRGSPPRAGADLHVRRAVRRP